MQMDVTARFRSKPDCNAEMIILLYQLAPQTWNTAGCHYDGYYPSSQDLTLPTSFDVGGTAPW